MKNTLRYTVGVISYQLTLLTMGATLLQSYLIERGFSEESTGFFFSSMRAVQVAVILLTMFAAERCRRPRIPTAFVCLGAIPLALYFLLLPEGVGISALPLYLLGGVLNVAFGVYNILSYRLPYAVMDMRDYGRISGLAGAVSALLTLLASLAISLLGEIVAFDTLMRTAFAATAVFALVGFLATLTLRETPLALPDPSEGRPSLLRYRPFTALIPATLLRGLSAGIVALAATLGYMAGLLDSRSASLMVILTGVVTMLGGFAYTFLTTRVAPRPLLLVACTGAALTLPLMPLGGTPLFLAAFSLATFFITLVDYAVPVTVTRFVDHGMISRYTGGRMLLHNLGITLSGFLGVWLSERIGILLPLVLAGGMLLAFGLLFCRYLKKINL